MKTKMNSMTRMILLMGVVILLGSAGAGLFLTLKVPNTVQEEQMVYSYQATPKTEYKVNLIPNILYKETYLESGQTYVSEFVKDISSLLTYSISGSEEAKWQGIYQVEADLRAYYKDQDEKKIIWSKVDTVISKKEISETAKEISIKEKAIIDFPKYNQFSAAVIEASKVNAAVELELRMIGNMSATIKGKVVEEPINVSLIIPMQTGYFNIEQVGATSDPKTITQSVEKNIPPNKGVVFGCSMMIVIAVMVGIFLVFLTEGMGGEDKNTKQVKKIIKEHGSRMVAINECIKLSSTYVYELMEIDDLVKVADELQLPILYPYNYEIEEHQYFYVESGEKVYMYRIHREEKQIVEKNLEKSEAGETI